MTVYTVCKREELKVYKSIHSYCVMDYHQSQSMQHCHCTVCWYDSQCDLCLHAVWRCVDSNPVQYSLLKKKYSKYTLTMVVVSKGFWFMSEAVF